MAEADDHAILYRVTFTQLFNRHYVSIDAASIRRHRHNPSIARMWGFAEGRAERHFLGVARSVTGRAWTRAARCARRGASRRRWRSAASPRKRWRACSPGAASSSTTPPPSSRRRCGRICPIPRRSPTWMRPRRASPTRWRRREASRSSATTTWTAPPRRRCCTACSRRSAARPRIYIPDRIFEGYGPNPEAIDKLIDGGARPHRLRRLRLDELRGAGAGEGARRRRDRARPPPGRHGAAAGRRHRQPEPRRTTFPARASSPRSA